MSNKWINKYRALPTPAKAAMWFAMSNIVTSGCRFFIMPFLVRALTTEQYGTYSIFLSWINFLANFATLHLDGGVYNNAMIKYPDRRSEYISSIQSLCMVLTAAVFAIYLLAPSAWDSFFGLDRKITLLIFVQLFFSMSFSLWTGRQKFEYHYVLMLLYAVTLALLHTSLPVIIAYLFPQEQRLMAVVYSSVAIQAVSGLCFMVYNYIQGRRFFEGKFWLFALRFNLPLIPHFFAGSILGQADRIMIDHYIGSAEAGIYSFTYTISHAMNIITGAITSAIIPYLFQKMRAQKYDGLKTVSEFLLLFIGTIVLALSAMAPELIRIVGTPAYYDAINLVPVIALSTYFTFLYGLIVQIEYYFEETKFIMTASIIAAALNVVLNYIFLPVFGYYAAGYTTLFCYIVFALSHYIFMRMECRKHINGEKVYRGERFLFISLFFTVCSFGVILLYDHAVIRYMLLLLAAALCIHNRGSIINGFKTIKKAEKQEP